MHHTLEPDPTKLDLSSINISAACRDKINSNTTPVTHACPDSGLDNLRPHDSIRAIASYACVCVCIYIYVHDPRMSRLRIGQPSSPWFYPRNRFLRMCVCVCISIYMYMAHACPDSGLDNLRPHDSIRAIVSCIYICMYMYIYIYIYIYIFMYVYVYIHTNIHTDSGLDNILPYTHTHTHTHTRTLAVTGFNLE